MNELKQWALCLIIGGLAGTFAVIAAPNGAASKTIRTVTGIFIVLVVCSPLSKLGKGENILPAFNEYSNGSESDKEENIKEYMISVCRESVKNEIENAARSLGASVKSAEVDMYINDEYCIIIQEVAVETDYAQTGELSSVLNEKLGVPVRIISG